ncbi:ABC transporter related protein [Caldalkalibacillus thermarum TA2.A1]|uniref:ABC transporter related protein n=1 Tax=Caldalkalibacillus thermarum (strain TA2.A1) TaxID=986075 RepID=F5L8T5_CALTT|nr:ABC transporter transmembrane domain-containing protein [Caldalkalibacillus thermarum]EGL82217.1 ABC transporter related protein [Caldalkalibacillus thermarum TA2.A1]QZT32767.1 ATP-binding cassette domain-containing protein [Caldalkalibacillus thermarum TA2.A1]
MGIFKDLMWFFNQEKTSYLLGICCLVLVSLLTLLPPYVVGLVVDRIAEGTLTPAELWRWLGILLASGVVVYALRFAWRVLIFGAALRLGRLLRNRLYHHFTLMSPEFYQQRRIGDLMAHSTNDVQAIEATAGEGVLTLVDSLTLGGLVIVMMFTTLHAPLTLIVLIPMPIMAWATSYYGKLLHQRFHLAQAAFSDMNDKVQENISGMRVIKAFGQEEAEKAAFKRQTDDVVNKNIAVSRIDALFDPTISLIVGVSFFLAITFGSWFIIRGEMTVGQLTTFTMYLGMLIWPMLAFGWLFNIVERGRASYDRVSSLLSIQPAVKHVKGALKHKPQGDIQYDIDAFFYPGQQRPALQNIRIRIRQGHTLGVIGKTGAGKTTLVRLLLREFDCTAGDIQIGGVSIYRYSLDALRQSIGYVPQDHFLFSATIRENIAFGRPQAAMEEIEEVARIACIHDDILHFDQGYETVVGERGVTLSGGQKQRLAIARALLMDPEILILDDALSAVDAQTEETILKALKDYRRNKTTLIASHRLSSVEHAEEIVVLSEGQIVERGTHQELMELGGWYRMMYDHQQLESLVEKGG